MGQVFLAPSNPGATTQAQRDAAGAANIAALRNAAASVSRTTSPVRVGPTGANQGIIRLAAGNWFFPPNSSLGATFDNLWISPAPGATIWPSSGVSGHIFTVQTPNNFTWLAGLWADTGNGAAVRTMANKNGSGWPVIAANLGGGDPQGPRITATGDPRVPWTYPVDEMFSVMVDRSFANWINNHCGFLKINKAGTIEVDRVFYFGYVEGTSSGAAMIVPAASSQGNPIGSNSCRKLILKNQYMINAPQGFGLNQFTDVNEVECDHMYCVGGEAVRAETHVSKDGGITISLTANYVAQAGGNAGVALTAHQEKNGKATIAHLWAAGPENGAIKLRQGLTGAPGSFAAGSTVRDVIVLGTGSKTWGQKQTVPAGESEGNFPCVAHNAIQRTATWQNNVAFLGPIAFGHIDDLGSTTAGVAVGQTAGTAQGFEIANASDGIAATTRDLTGGGVVVDPDPDPDPVTGTTGRFAGQHLAHLHRVESVFHRLPNAAEARRWGASHDYLFGQWRSGEAGHSRAFLPANGLYTYDGTARAEPDMLLGNPDAQFGLYLNGTKAEGETFGADGGAPSGGGAFDPYFNAAVYDSTSPTYFGNYDMVLDNVTHNTDLSAQTNTPFGDTNPAYLKVVHPNWRFWLPRWTRYMLEKHPAGASIYKWAYYDIMSLAAGQQSLTNMTGLINALASYLHPLGFLVRINSLQDGASYWATPSSTAGNRQLVTGSNADMHNMEFFLKDPSADGDTYPSSARWVADVSAAMDVQKNDKIVSTSTKIYDNGAISGYDPETGTPQWRELVVATDLIANRGSMVADLLPFGMSQQDDASPPGKASFPDLSDPWQAAWRFWHEQPFYNPIYGVELGNPIDPNEAAATADNSATQASKYLRGGVYQRRFEKGIAIVNVSGSSKDVALDARDYTEIDGTAVTSPVTVANNHGRVLLVDAPVVDSGDIPRSDFTDTTITLEGGVRQSTTAASLSLGKPPTLADGDVLVLQVESEDTSGGTPSGATRLHFHDTAANVVAPFTGAETSSRTASAGVARARDLEVGLPAGPAVNSAVSTVAGVALERLYLGAWVSKPLRVSSITAQTWTGMLAGNEADLNASQSLGVHVWVLKSDGTKRGDVYDGDVALTTALSTGTKGKAITFAGSSVASVANNSDRLVIEIWTRGTPAVSGTVPVRFRYGGTVEPADETAELQPAPWVETPQTLFGVAGAHGSFSPPAGFHEIGHSTSTDADGDAQGAAWYKVASNAAAEPATYNVGLPDSGGAIGTLTNWRGVDPTLLLTATASGDTDIDGAPTAAAVTTTEDGGLALFLVGAHNAGGISWTDAALEEAWHEVRTAGSGSEHQVSAAVMGLASAGSSGTLDASLAAAAAWSSFAIAFDAVSDVPPVTSDVVLEVSEETGNGRNQLLATVLSENAVLIDIYRKHPSGVVWPVRGMQQAQLNGDTFLGYDYEAPIRWGVLYYAIAYDSAGNVVGRSLDVPSFWDTDLEWLTDPVRAHRGFPVVVASNGLPEEAYSSRAALHDVIGRPNPVVISQTRGGATGTVAILTLTLEERDQMQVLLAAGGPLLLRTSPEAGVRSLYMLPLDIAEQRPGPVNIQPERVWVIQYREVDPPPGVATGGRVTWDDVAATYDDWNDLTASVGSWLDLLDGREVDAGSVKELLPWRGT